MGVDMISVSEAKSLILQAVMPGPPENLAAAAALHRVLAESLLAPLDLPGFDNSAMDGYALKSCETVGADPKTPARFRVHVEIPAGGVIHKPLLPGEAARVYTGAMIPPGSDAVVIQEAVQRTGDELRVSMEVPVNSNIRRRGEEIRQGERALDRGSPLNAAALGWLASLGIREVTVHAKPTVGILVTGSELVAPGRPLEPGQIYESNSPALTASLREIFLEPSFVKIVPDGKGAIGAALAEGLERCDFLLMTGGVSVGDYDFVKEMAHEAGVQEVFWKVRQKPGKPLFFGKTVEDKFVFGLPGNPASVLVCFYEYVRPALLKAMGNPRVFLPALKLPLEADLQLKGGKAEFLRGELVTSESGWCIRINRQQGSHILKTFATSHILVFFPEATTSVKAGDEVEAHLLPHVCGGGIYES